LAAGTDDRDRKPVRDDLPAVLPALPMPGRCQSRAEVPRANLATWPSRGSS